nr:hypothetical protein [Yonghaparkia sp. Soil809]
MIDASSTSSMLTTRSSLGEIENSFKALRTPMAMMSLCTMRASGSGSAEPSSR